MTRDYSTSYVRFPPDAAPTTGKTETPISSKRAQSVCLSLALEPTFLSANAEFSENPDLFGPKLPTMYIGLDDGVYRMFPSKPVLNHTYDPRVRPWYVWENTPRLA